MIVNDHPFPQTHIYHVGLTVYDPPYIQPPLTITRQSFQELYRTAFYFPFGTSQMSITITCFWLVKQTKEITKQ